MAFDLDDEELKATREMPCNKNTIKFFMIKKGDSNNDKCKEDEKQTNK